MSFIYRSISSYRQHLNISYKLCTPVRLKVTGISHGTLLPLTLKTSLKTQSRKLYNNKYMIASTQITKTEIFAFTAVPVFKLLSCRVLFIKIKDNKIC